uniref:Uncharacterized protein n=1 Tax=Candidatus Kentrum sp. LFY TaxID=2126342 RepID=A0A450UVD3_9GAMM|nr:MAG: hypothetical protein BECKLFY1418B_GA0070995_108514 [Candidatus Kentron sp. LFY]
MFSISQVVRFFRNVPIFKGYYFVDSLPGGIIRGMIPRMREAPQPDGGEISGCQWSAMRYGRVRYHAVGYGPWWAVPCLQIYEEGFGVFCDVDLRRTLSRWLECHGTVLSGIKYMAKWLRWGVCVFRPYRCAERLVDAGADG